MSVSPFRLWPNPQRCLRPGTKASPRLCPVEGRRPELPERASWLILGPPRFGEAEDAPLCLRRRSAACPCPPLCRSRVLLCVSPRPVSLRGYTVSSQVRHVSPISSRRVKRATPRRDRSAGKLTGRNLFRSRTPGGSGRPTRRTCATIAMVRRRRQGGVTVWDGSVGSSVRHGKRRRRRHRGEPLNPHPPPWTESTSRRVRRSSWLMWRPRA